MVLPSQIHNIPQEGALEYLFKKSLTQSDIKLGLMLIGYSNAYFRALPKPEQDTISSQGLNLYTPKGIFYVGVKSTRRPGVSFTLRNEGWLAAVEENGFNVGDEIDCWVLYLKKEGEAGTYSVLVEKNLSQAPKAAEGEEGGN